MFLGTVGNPSEIRFKKNFCLFPINLTYNLKMSIFGRVIFLISVFGRVICSLCIPVIHGCRDRRLSTNFELWVEIFVCRHVSMWGFPKPCLSVRTTRKEILLASSISVLQLVIDTSTERSSRVLHHGFAELLEKSRLITESVKMLFQYAVRCTAPQGASCQKSCPNIKLHSVIFVRSPPVLRWWLNAGNHI